MIIAGRLLSISEPISGDGSDNPTEDALFCYVAGYSPMTPIGFVHIIESPSSMDLLDGRTEGHSLCESLMLAGIPASYCLATDKRSLIESVGNRLLSAWRKHEVSPILHLSMHGSEQGIGLTNGEVISWDQLRFLLQPLLDAMNGGLLVCLSSCHGTHGRRMAMCNETDATFWALVTNHGAVSWSDAAVGYISFYHLLFRGLAVETCVGSMRVASGNHEFACIYGQRVKDDWQQFSRSIQAKLGQRIEQAAQAVESRSTKVVKQ